MKIHAAEVTEQGIAFVIVEVKSGVLKAPTQSAGMRQLLQKKFPGREVVLMTRNINSRPTFSGREDIAKFLSKRQVQKYPWKMYEV